MTNRYRAITLVLAGSTLLAILFSGFWFGGFRVNLTLSAPIGVWRVETLDREVQIGDLIFICLPTDQPFAQPRSRGYIGFGLCPGWLSPLIKTVRAVPGQYVRVAERVAVGGVELPNSSPLETDSEGRPLSAHAGGVVPKRHVFILSDYPGSYDSRYFGPISIDGVIGLAKPVLVVSP